VTVRSGEVRRIALPLLAALFALPALLALDGCGGGGGGNELIVSAASSLETPFTDYAKSIDGDVRQSFAGSDTLAAQIQNGARPDVFASADVRYPQELFKAGLAGKPVVFAGNRLVVAVPRRSPFASLADLARPGVRVITGDDGVPVGIYTAELLAGLPRAEGAGIKANVRSREPDVSGIVGKLTQGAADAGFVYATDVQAAEGELKAIAIPHRLQPPIAYSVTVVEGSGNPEGANAFIEGLVDGDGAAALRRAGFPPPP